MEWLEAVLSELAELRLGVLALEGVEALEGVLILDGVEAELAVETSLWLDRVLIELGEVGLVPVLLVLSVLPLETLEALEGDPRLTLERVLWLEGVVAELEMLEREPAPVTLDLLERVESDSVLLVVALEVALEALDALRGLWLDLDWLERVLELELELAVLSEVKVISLQLEKVLSVLRLCELRELTLEAVLKVLTLEPVLGVLALESVELELVEAIGYSAGLKGRIPAAWEWQSLTAYAGTGPRPGSPAAS